MKYLSQLLSNNKPRTHAKSSARLSRNHAGGLAWKVDEWTMLDRFLILGSEGGTYYVRPRELTLDHARNVAGLLNVDGLRVVRRVVEISVSGRAPKNDAAVFALAIAASLGDEPTRRAAAEALPKVCRTGTHLFAFAAACNQLRGWGRLLRRAVADWYTTKELSELELSLVKYRQREGWAHRDLLRLAHPMAKSDEQNALFRWTVRGEVPETGAPLIRAAQALKNVVDPHEAAEIIRVNRLPREGVPTEWLNHREVWNALLEAMPLHAMVRNLGVMTKVGLLKDTGAEWERQPVRHVCDALRNPQRLANARLHPVALLMAANVYARGRGVKGAGEWEPVQAIRGALSSAFYDAMWTVPATGKRVLVGLDVSGSMEGTQAAGSEALSCREACGAMALVTVATELDPHFVAFDTRPYPLQLKRGMLLEQVVETMAKTGGGGTDCAQPILHALRKRIEVDAFVIYTDSETWAGETHPAHALEQYREKMGLPAKLVVVQLASTRTTIAPPLAPYALDVVGFDAAVPQIISDFLRD